MAFSIVPTGTARTRGAGSPTIKVYIRDELLDLLEDDINDVFIQPSEGDFAIDVAYTHVTGETAVLTGIFDDPHTNVNLQSDAEFNTIKPQIRIQESKLLREIKKDDTLEVKGNLYFVENYIGDGVGIIRLFLRKK